MKKSKENYYNHFFQSNLKNIRNIWKGIKSITSNSATDLFVLQSIYSNGTLTSDSEGIADAFNDYFCNVAKDIQSSIRFSFKSFQDYLKNIFQKTFFISPIDSIEISDIISHLSSDKSHGLEFLQKFCICLKTKYLIF